MRAATIDPLSAKLPPPSAISPPGVLGALGGPAAPGGLAAIAALLAAAVPPPKLHDVTVVRRKKYGCTRIEAVPPEDFSVSRHTKHMSEATYCAHRVRRTFTQLVGQGIDEDILEGLFSTGAAENGEAEARDTVEENTESGGDSLNKATREIVVTEHYCLLDYENDGKPRLYRITTGGDADTILTRDGVPMIEAADMVCFAAMTPIIMTHRLYGRSVADLVIEIQSIKTVILRGMLDNIYRANNQRIEVSSEHAHEKTLDDLLTNRPGGLVRTIRPGGLNPIPNQSLGDFVFPMMEYQDAVREWRTGVTRQGQGLDPEALSNATVGAVAKVFSAAQGKIKLIARIFAETGIRDLVVLVHAITRKHATQADTVRLRNKWVTVDPRDWKKREDLTVKVGVSGASREAEMVFWGSVMNIQKQALQTPGVTIANQKNIYHAAKKYVELGGEKAVSLYFTDPDTVAPAAPPKDPKLIELEARAAPKTRIAK